MTFGLIRTGTALALAATLSLPVFASDLLRPNAPLPQQGNGLVIPTQNAEALVRINELQEEVRRLNGKVEELTFQLLQMQEDMRRLQQDNELRFQELEERRGDAGSTQESDVAIAEPKAEENRLGKPEASGDNSSDANPETDAAPDTTSTAPQPEAPRRSLEPKMLGTLTFDAQGNVIAARPSESVPQGEQLPGVFSNGVDGGVEAAEFGPTPDAVFDVGRRALENRRYQRAEQALAAFLKAWPTDPRTGEARFHLAEALFWQQKYLEAANLHLDTHNDFPEASTAPDNLLGLGLALAGLNQREVACVTYSEVLKQYPEAVDRLGDRILAEQASAKCL